MGAADSLFAPGEPVFQRRVLATCRKSLLLLENHGAEVEVIVRRGAEAWHFRANPKHGPVSQKSPATVHEMGLVHLRRPKKRSPRGVPNGGPTPAWLEPSVDLSRWESFSWEKWDNFNWKNEVWAESESTSSSPTQVD